MTTIQLERPFCGLVDARKRCSEVRQEDPDVIPRAGVVELHISRANPRM